MSVVLTPSTIPNQEYTVTNTLLTLTFSAFTANPSFCAITYTYSVTDPAGAGAISSFDSATRKFNFYYTNLSLSGGYGFSFADYTVTVIGTAGIVV